MRSYFSLNTSNQRYIDRKMMVSFLNCYEVKHHYDFCLYIYIYITLFFTFSSESRAVFSFLPMIQQVSSLFARTKCTDFLMNMALISGFACVPKQAGTRTGRRRLSNT